MHRFVYYAPWQHELSMQLYTELFSVNSAKKKSSLLSAQHETLFVTYQDQTKIKI